MKKRLAGVQRSDAFQHLIAGALLVEAGLTQLQGHPARMSRWLLNRLVRGPRVEIDDQGLFVRTTIFRRRSVAWADVVGLTRTSRGVDLQLARGGMPSFNFTDAMNRDAVEQAIASAWQAIDESRVPAPELSPAN